MKYRFGLQAGCDAAMWAVALLVATVLRFEFEYEFVELASIAKLAAVVCVLQVAVGSMAGLYVHRWRFGTMEEVFALARVTFVVEVLLVLLNLHVLDRAIPLAATLIAGPLALMGMVAARFTWRMFHERSNRPRVASAERVLVFGAGEGGAQVIRAMISDPSSPYVPVGIIDDQRVLRNLRIKNVPVMGTRDELAAVAAKMGCRTIIIAIPSADGELIRELVAIADAAHLTTLVLPTVANLFGPSVGISDIRPLDESDLLGRREINTDISSVADYITGRRVLVTGAGGSIGSELCRQIYRFAPETVIMLDRDESALQGVQLSIEGRGLLDSDHLVVACIRDIERVREVFEAHRPDVVFHAAALKHLSLLEMHPEEGFKTNVVGTQNLLTVAREFGVGTFVNISTDKAADASSVLGRTKRLAERLTAHAAQETGGVYLSVRFGNVLGSRGSVVPLFRTQIEQGGPVTVTHPDVTRFFMTIEEACQLVVQAGATGHNGDVLVLDMGEPVRILDLARRLVAESNRPIDIEFTGLRPGEKLHEVLFAPGEDPRPSRHPLISRVRVPSLDPAGLFNQEADMAPPPALDFRRTTPSGSNVETFEESA